MAINDAPHIMTANKASMYGTNFDFDIYWTCVMNVGNVNLLGFFDFNSCLLYTDFASEITEEWSKELVR